MPKGPKGEYRPADPFKAGNIVMRIALGELTEAEARALGEKEKKRRAAKRMKSSPRSK